MVKDFDGHDYTQTSVIEELLLIERHARDGSAYNAGCGCIEEKHLLTLSGLASEMPTLSKDENEKKFYMDLADWAREMRTAIISGEFPSLTAENHKNHGNHSVKCEAKVHKCIASGKTEEECRLELGCVG